MSDPENPHTFIQRYLSGNQSEVTGYQNGTVGRTDSFARIITETIQQIRKDFSMFGITLPSIPETTDVYNHLVLVITAEIERELVSNPVKVSALLYQIDINEMLIVKECKQRPELSRTEIITELIIYRELKKVVFRNYYKELKNKQ